MTEEFKPISGFSKLSRNQKIDLLALDKLSKDILNEAISASTEIREVVNDLSENTISHFTFPFGIAPNVVVNGKNYFLPLVTEESSVVAAISKATRFWSANGGFYAKIKGITKKGQVHFFWKGNEELLNSKFAELKVYLFKQTAPLTERMVKRGGGIRQIRLDNKTSEIDNYYRLDVDFETIDAMGANFINTCLENMAKSLSEFVENDKDMDSDLLQVNMAILSNYTPDSLAYARVSCQVEQLNEFGNKQGVADFAKKFVLAVQIAHTDVSRAVTHNKGIFNGIDAVLLATANDWRAVEACGHAFASRNGAYRSLSDASIKDGIFTLELNIPMAVGTFGGVTNLHPMARLALEILKKPSANELMQIIAVSGLAANFSAVSALISTGIQKGHMKMHMSNIKRRLLALEKEKLFLHKNNHPDSKQHELYYKNNS